MMEALAFALDSGSNLKSMMLGFLALMTIAIVAVFIAVSMHRAARRASKPAYGAFKREARRGGADSLVSHALSFAVFALASIALVVVGMMKMDTMTKVVALLLVVIVTSLAMSVVRLVGSGLSVGDALRIAFTPRRRRDDDDWD